MHDVACPPRPPDLRRRGKRRCPFNDELFLRRLGLWCKIPLACHESEMVWRCDISAGVTDISLIDRHYATGEITRRICAEFCRAHDEYRRRMRDYSIRDFGSGNNRDGGDDSREGAGWGDTGATAYCTQSGSKTGSSVGSTVMGVPVEYRVKGRTRPRQAPGGATHV